MTTIIVNNQFLFAKNKKNQTQFNKCVRALERYNELNDMRNKVEDTGDEFNYQLRRLNRMCENQFDKFQAYLEELPKYEQKKITNSNIY
jgi:hypothetical protein